MDPTIVESDFSGSAWDTANSTFEDFPHHPEPQKPLETKLTNADQRNELMPPPAIADESKFACPYRKHNPEKYTLQDWRSCALSGFPTVARVK